MRTWVLAPVFVVALAGCYESHARSEGPRSDAGLDVRCDEETLPEVVGRPCSDAVSACRSACARADEPCRDACLDAPCRACVFGTIFHCANEAGCEPLWRELACCVESVPGCGDLRGLDRTMCARSCPMRFEPYAMCIESMGGEECFLRAARNCELR